MSETSFKPRSMVWHYAKVVKIKGLRLTLEYTSQGSNAKKLIERSKRQVVRIAHENELNFNTKAHYEKMLDL